MATPEDDAPPAAGEDANPPVSTGPGEGTPTEGAARTADRVLDPYIRTASRIARAVRGLLAAHVIVVRSEAERELFRYTTGLALVIGALMFLFCSSILFAVSLVEGIRRVTGLELLESLLVCLAITLSLAGVLGLLGWLRLRKAPMPQSRELIQQTLRGLDPRE